MQHDRFARLVHPSSPLTRMLASTPEERERERGKQLALKVKFTVKQVHATCSWHEQTFLTNEFEILKNAIICFVGDLHRLVPVLQL